MLQACYKFSTCARFLIDKRRRRKKFESNIDSLLIYLFARQEKIEFEFYVLTCKIEEERNNNDFFARGSESKEKKWWNFTERQEQRTRFPRMRRTVTTRGVVWRGGEKGRNTIHGGRQRERDYDLHRWTVRFLRYPLSLNSRLHVQPPNVRLLVENRGTRGISRDCLRYLWRWRASCARPTLSTLHELFSPR